MNTFGTTYTLTSFGESHGPAIGGVIDGMSAGVHIDLDKLQAALDRRRPGQSALTTARNEPDKVQILSGIIDANVCAGTSGTPDYVTLGTPIGFVIPNTSHHSNDYDTLRNTYRPGHADYTYQAKYGIRDHRGGGRASARETATRIVAGALAMQAMTSYGIEVRAYTRAIGGISADINPMATTPSLIDANAVRCPDTAAAAAMETAILEAKDRGDTLGGIIECVITGMPAGIGDPVAGKLQALLAEAMMSIPAAKGFEYGMGFDGATRQGSQVIDSWMPAPDDLRGITTATNNSGGIQGGISNGEPIVMRVAFKPVATLLRPVQTVDSEHRAVTLEVHGRHDPCVVPRAVPVVEAMAAITVFGALLRNRIARI